MIPLLRLCRNCHCEPTLRRRGNLIRLDSIGIATWSKGLLAMTNEEKYEFMKAYLVLCTLAVAAAAADGATTLVFHNPAAIRAGTFEK